MTIAFQTVNGRRVVTRHMQTTIPPWDHWIAYDDDMGADTSPIGAGKTEAEAIDDLMQRLEDAA
jgi:hypothetical protein